MFWSYKKLFEFTLGVQYFWEGKADGPMSTPADAPMMSEATPEALDAIRRSLATSKNAREKSKVSQHRENPDHIVDEIEDTVSPSPDAPKAEENDNQPWIKIWRVLSELWSNFGVGGALAAPMRSDENYQAGEGELGEYSVPLHIWPSMRGWKHGTVEVEETTKEAQVLDKDSLLRRIAVLERSFTWKFIPDARTLETVIIPQLEKLEWDIDQFNSGGQNEKVAKHKLNIIKNGIKKLRWTISEDFEESVDEWSYNDAADDGSFEDDRRHNMEKEVDYVSRKQWLLDMIELLNNQLTPNTPMRAETLQADIIPKYQKLQEEVKNFNAWDQNEKVPMHKLKKIERRINEIQIEMNKGFEESADEWSYNTWIDDGDTGEMLVGEDLWFDDGNIFDRIIVSEQAEVWASEWNMTYYTGNSKTMAPIYDGEKPQEENTLTWEEILTRERSTQQNIPAETVEKVISWVDLATLKSGDYFAIEDFFVQTLGTEEAKWVWFEDFNNTQEKDGKVFHQASRINKMTNQKEIFYIALDGELFA